MLLSLAEVSTDSAKVSGKCLTKGKGSLEIWEAGWLNVPLND